MGLTLVFSQLQVLLSDLGEKRTKKKKERKREGRKEEGIKKIEGKKGRRN